MEQLQLPIEPMSFFCLAFLAILFLQSGLDKVFDYAGNKAWLTEHFSKSPLKGTVGLLLPIITFLEVAAGIACAIGIIELILGKKPGIGYIGILLSGISILALFFGQRMAKDYAGAGGLVPYFIVVILALFVLW